MLSSLVVYFVFHLFLPFLFLLSLLLVYSDHDFSAFLLLSLDTDACLSPLAFVLGDFLADHSFSWMRFSSLLSKALLEFGVCLAR